MDDILVAVGNKSNAKLIESILKNHYNIFFHEKDKRIYKDFDLIIVDGLMLSSYKEDYEDYRKSISPLFLPILLVTAKNDEHLITKQIWKIVDDLITLPILKMELCARVETLLRARRQSIELKVNQELIRSKERMAQASAEKYLTLFNSMDEGFCIIQKEDKNDGSIDFRYLEINPAFEIQSGVAAVIGKTIHELFPDEAFIWCKIYDDVLKTGIRRFTQDFIIKGLVLELCAFPIEPRSNKQVAVIFKNITENRRAEENLRDSEERAITLVKELQVADRYKNQFISVLSHELRNPLASISAGLELLEITQDDHITSNAKKIIKRQMQQLCKLVDDLLDVTRITQNKIKLKREIININEIVRNAMEDIKPEFDKKGVRLGTKIQVRPISLYADPVRIRQIIGNILYNALKFTSTNGAVWLSLKQDKNDALIKVKDNGKGVSPEILPNLFKPFIQADQDIDRRDGGLGLGLSVVKGIAELHGGYVSAYSAGVGKGAEFTISLPIFRIENKGD